MYSNDYIILPSDFPFRVLEVRIGGCMRHEPATKEKLKKVIAVWKKVNPHSAHYKHYKERLEYYDRDNQR